MMVSDGDGIVCFDVCNYFGCNDVVLQVDVRYLYNYCIEGINFFYEKYVLIILLFFHVVVYLVFQLRECYVQMQVYNIYDVEKISQFVVLEVDMFVFYGIFSRKYWLDDYVCFIIMEEVLCEYVFEVVVCCCEG